MTKEDYIRNSLELHLFFDRIMKEHSFFLEAAFMSPQHEAKKIARDFQLAFADILEKVTQIANRSVSKDFLESQQIVTTKTVEAEKKSSMYTGIEIPVRITENELNLQPGNLDVSDEVIRQISVINQKTLPIINKLILFKTEILNQVLTCKIYTANYPLLITHITNEAKMYYNLLNKVEKREDFSKEYLYEQEMFWNNIMKEHAEFMRGLLDPVEKELILTADRYADEYDEIIKKYRDNPEVLKQMSLKETLEFQKFKTAGNEGILNCKIKSIIVPLLADHVLREANHFIRILNMKD